MRSLTRYPPWFIDLEFWIIKNKEEKGRTYPVCVADEPFRAQRALVPPAVLPHEGCNLVEPVGRALHLRHDLMVLQGALHLIEAPGPGRPAADIDTYTVARRVKLGYGRVIPDEEGRVVCDARHGETPRLTRERPLAPLPGAPVPKM